MLLKSISNILMLLFTDFSLMDNYSKNLAQGTSPLEESRNS